MSKQIEYKSIESIKPYPKNAKKHPRDQIVKIAESIKRYGFNQPIVVDKNNVIIVGHGRYLAAKRLGLNEVPVLVVDLDEKKAKAYRLADNKLNSTGFDFDLVAEELLELDQIDVDLLDFRIKLKEENPEEEFATELMEEQNYLIFTFDNRMDWLAVSDYFGLKRVKSQSGRTRGIGRVLDGKKLLKILGL